MRAPEERGMEHAWKRDIGNVLPAAMQEAIVFFAQQAISYAALRHFPPLQGCHEVWSRG
jgi:hypothetical protein